MSKFNVTDEQLDELFTDHVEHTISFMQGELNSREWERCLWNMKSAQMSRQMVSFLGPDGARERLSEWHNKA